MSEELETISKQAQHYYKEIPLVILGSGASAAHSMATMGDLAAYLIDQLPETNEAVDASALGSFKQELQNGTGLEQALDRADLTEDDTNQILLMTWHLLAKQDSGIFLGSLTKRNFFPLGKLLRNLFTSTVRELNIITTNYDHLAEYACEQEHLHHYTGFSHGYRGHLAPKDYLSSRRQVNIWKVHGSLNWMSDENGVICSLNNITSIPSGFTPLIVTPGTEKYRKTHKEPFKTIIHSADDSIDSARAYLCIGFGFNDEHIQEKLINKCAKEDVAIIIIAYSLTSAARRLLAKGAIRRYLAIEANGDSSRIYSSELERAHDEPGNHWSLSGFINLII